MTLNNLIEKFKNVDNTYVLFVKGSTGKVLYDQQKDGLLTIMKLSYSHVKSFEYIYSNETKHKFVVTLEQKDV